MIMKVVDPCAVGRQDMLLLIYVDLSLHCVAIAVSIYHEIAWTL
jgi:hypothetical protein